ncbi:helix-turn-helix domain-containing protein [Gemmatimonas sp.]|uniref:helix-turn-helix domain-containing protein n=1 Tax=Gemmatimonas sp. TaxID=1962908 RepID=UPI0039837628
MARRVSTPTRPTLMRPRADTAVRGGRVVDAVELGQVLRWMRGTKGVRQLEAAASLGVSPELLRGLERGDRGVHLGTALDVIARLGLDLVLVPRDPTMDLRDEVPKGDQNRTNANRGERDDTRARNTEASHSIDESAP